MTDRFNLLSQHLLQKDISDCSVEELQQLSQQYPYFAPAQIILLKKLREENNIEYAQQFQKAALYYHDPLAFNFYINDHDFQTDFPAGIIQTEIGAPDNIVHEISDKPAEFEENPEVPGSEFESKSIDVDQEVSSLVAENNEIPVIETSGFEIMEDSRKEQEEKLKDIEPETTPNEVKHAETVASSLSFEPYHTVDYFASVGIKLNQEEVGKDNFGRQLKSFTEWLKTMKRLPAAEQLKKLDPHAEEKVENIAAHSLDNSEILTETMAEVWVKQGKLEKAIEVYNKLSLLNPSKRAYFATKLENLKKAL